VGYLESEMTNVNTQTQEDKMTRTTLSQPQEKQLEAVRAAFKDEVVGEHAVRLGRQMLKHKAGIRSTPPGKSMYVNLSIPQAAKVATMLGVETK
jgi:hypothetical protein